MASRFGARPAELAYIPISDASSGKVESRLQREGEEEIIDLRGGSLKEACVQQATGQPHLPNVN